MVKSEGREKKDAPKKSVWDLLYQWRMALSAILFTVVVVLGAWILVYPRWTLLAALEQSTIDQQKANGELKELVGRLNTFVKNYEEALKNPGLALLPTIVPDSIDVARVFVDFESLGAQTGLKLTSIDVGKEGGGSVAAKLAKGAPTSALPKGILSYPIRVQFDGDITYEGYKQLLVTIESSLPLYDVLSGSIEGQQALNKKGSGKSLDLEIRSYYRPPSEKK